VVSFWGGIIKNASQQITDADVHQVVQNIIVPKNLSITFSYTGLSAKIRVFYIKIYPNENLLVPNSCVNPLSLKF